MFQAYQKQHTVFVFGNGGSAALASHLACDLGKGTVNCSPRRFKVMALTDNVALMTAWANDSHYENIFSEQLANFARPQDVAFAISASGNSANVLKALNAARQSGLITAGLTGFHGGHAGTLRCLRGRTIRQHAGHRGSASLYRARAIHLSLCHSQGISE